MTGDSPRFPGGTVPGSSKPTASGRIPPPVAPRQGQRPADPEATPPPAASRQGQRPADPEPASPPAASRQGQQPADPEATPLPVARRQGQRPSGEDPDPPVAPHPTLRRRPTSLDPRELGFTPRPMVAWLAPLQLLNTGLRSLLAIIFGNYLDKRELQNALPSDVHCQQGTDGEIWLDYVADLGDGFDSTYSVAYLLGRPRLEVGAGSLPRGQMLLMGGDQVYPTPSARAYEDRFKGPYAAALPCPPVEGPRPTLYALPGNHDWYDGLTAFLRLFVRVKTDNIGGWCTEQSRSYFAVELPAGWWLFAIDEQFGSYLDDPQLLYFQQAAGRLADGDQVILAAPSPTWVGAADNPQAYETIDFFVRTVLDPAGARVRLIVSGDLHHYARYSGTERELVTCGGGGAYLFATHRLPERLTVPPPDSLARKRSPSREYALRARFPDKERSLRYGWGVFARLPRRNPGFAVLLGLIHVPLMLMILGLLTPDPMTGTEQKLFSIPLVLVVALTLLSGYFFAHPPGAGAKHGARHRLAGVCHGLAHVALAVAGAYVWLRLPFVDWPWPLPAVAAVALYGPVAGLLASEVVSLYLLIASWFGVNLNELFAAQGIEDAKSFLRMHIARDGTLTIYPLAVDRVCHRWRPAPEGAPDAPWFDPADGLSVRLVEPPIVLRPDRQPA